MVYTFAESAIWKQPLAKSTSSEAWQSSSEERYYAAVGKSMKRFNELALSSEQIGTIHLPEAIEAYACRNGKRMVQVALTEIIGCSINAEIPNVLSTTYSSYRIIKPEIAEP